MKRLSTALVLLALWVVSCSQPGSAPAPSAGGVRERPTKERSNDRASSAPAGRKDLSKNEDATRAEDRSPATEIASPGNEP